MPTHVTKAAPCARRHIVQWQCATHLLGSSTRKPTARQKQDPDAWLIEAPGYYGAFESVDTASFRPENGRISHRLAESARVCVDPSRRQAWPMPRAIGT